VKVMDRALVERARDGDQDAYARLASQISDRLYAVALRTLRDPAAAGDALQAALVSIWRDLPSLRDPTAFEGWSYRVVLNCCRAIRRSSIRPVASIVMDPLDASVGDTQESLAVRDELERGFRKLTIEQRVVLVLHYYRGLSVAEIGGGLGVSQGTVKSRLHAARRALRAAIEADERPVVQGGRPA
jgi:RNA polymerase sigma-70 factor (ECF subfamily)